MPGTSDGWIPKTISLNPEDYDRYRPTYPAEVFTAIQHYVPALADLRCLEIGVGTGQATQSFLDAGCRVVALEPADNLREYAVRKYRSQPNLQIRGYRFEELPDDEQFDLIYAATSFHWVEGEDRLLRLQSHLAPDGAVALYWIHPAPRDPVHAALQEVYAKYKPESPKPTPNKRKRADIETFPQELRDAGYRDVETHVFKRARELTFRAYIGLLHTYSDHLSLADEARIPLMRGIESVIEAHGGVIIIDDTIELHMAKVANDDPSR